MLNFTGMFGLGMGEILIIAVVALLVLGPEKLPQAAKTIGKGIRDFRRQTRELQETLEKDTQVGDAMRELKSALEDDPRRWPERARTPARAPGKEGSAPAIAPAAGAEPRPEGAGAEPRPDAPGPDGGGAPAAGQAKEEPPGSDGDPGKPSPVKRDESAHG